MKEIKRYCPLEDGEALFEHIHGKWCKWSDVEALQRELEDMTAKAIAAVWLLPENVGLLELRELREEARGVFLGKDKQVIAKLQDELRNAQEAYRTVVRPPVPGVNTVYARDYKNMVDMPLMLTGVRHAENGGLVIEVKLP